MMNYEENPVHNDTYDYTKPALSGFTGPINLGCPEETSILDLAKLIIHLTKSKSEIVFMPLPEDDPKRRQPDITIASQKLQWMPNTDLDVGLHEAIEYFRKTL